MKKAQQQYKTTETGLGHKVACERKILARQQKYIQSKTTKYTECK